MYEPHGWVKTPSDPNVSIWRYYKFSRFVDLVETSRLHFARFDQFSDPWEGVLPRETRPLEKDRFTHRPINPGDVLTDWQNYVLWVNRTNKLCGYANCWYENEHESDAMWKLYSVEGVAIRSTFARLRDSIEGDSASVHIGEIDYIDYQNAQPRTYGNTLAVMFAKGKQYEHERELRAAVVHIPEGFTCESPRYDAFLASHPTGQKIVTDLDTLIDRVYIAPGRPASFINDVQEVLLRAGLDKPVEPSSLDDRPAFL